MVDIQTEITLRMRYTLVSWLIEVAHEFRLLSETLFLTINYIDRILETIPIQRRYFQLLGISCLFIARYKYQIIIIIILFSKYEERYAPLLRDFIYMTDNSYSKNEMLECENMVLNTLQFDLNTVTVKNFFIKFSLIIGIENNNIRIHFNVSIYIYIYI